MKSSSTTRATTSNRVAVLVVPQFTGGVNHVHGGLGGTESHGGRCTGNGGTDNVRSTVLDTHGANQQFCSGK